MMRDKDECLKSIIIATRSGGQHAVMHQLAGYWADGLNDFYWRVNRLAELGEIKITTGKTNDKKLIVVGK